MLKEQHMPLSTPASTGYQELVACTRRQTHYRAIYVSEYVALLLVAYVH